MNSIIGYYSTKFGELWELSLDDLVKEAVEGVLVDSGLEKSQLDAIFFGNMLGGVVDRNLLFSSHIAEVMGVNIPIFRVEAACASGGVATQMANDFLTAHPNSTVAVIGAE